VTVALAVPAWERRPGPTGPPPLPLCPLFGPQYQPVLGQFLADGSDHVLLADEVARRPGQEGRGQSNHLDLGARQGLDPLQEVVDLDVGVPVVRVPDLGGLPEKGVGLVEKHHHVGALGVIEELSQRFSVSPMYLLTTWARSTR